MEGGVLRGRRKENVEMGKKRVPLSPRYILLLIVKCCPGIAKGREIVFSKIT